ncbi:Crp/Fnr family transcriptional regulator [Paenibacillus artemisiicola]|nr:Crp/Fnr family transcriptional regulator [Paenibacillus artemisiicola]
METGTAAGYGENAIPALSEGSLALLAGAMQVRHVGKGGSLFREGDRTEELFYVMRGKIRTVKSSDSGRTLTLYLHREGDLLGQLDPFPDSVHAFAAEAVEDAKVGVIRRAELEARLRLHGDLAIELVRWMGLMQRLTQTKLRDLIMFGKSGALCSLLIRLGNTCGVDKKGGLFLDVKLSHAAMADMIGATRESVNRMLGDLKKAGAIDTQEGCIIIKDVAYLRAVCHCENCPKAVCRM